ncbi:murein biosynthesis integral membrane protein MurJ [Gilvimarinus sp. F26214L]|uniref:murein biosynthesis integral membrane protein MurJ n=1 Tax=Gilvimarinus sp. DZF01 TaxID=3461371 RepID=UPI004046531B
MSDAEAAAPEDSPRLLRSSAVVGSMTMLSRVMGLIRDIVFARFIGAGPDADAFFIAFKIPNFLRRLFAEGAFSQAFVPVLSEYRERGSRAAVQELVDRVAGCLGSVLLTVTLIAVVGSPAVAGLFAMGFLDDDYKFGLTSDFVRITFPYLFLISMTGFAGAILNSYGRFAIPAFTPVLLNVALITAAIVVSPLFDPPALGLAWGVLAAGVVQLLFQFPFLYRLKLMPSPKVDWNHEGVRKILALMLPAIFGVSVSQINLLLDTVIASFLPTGSITWLYFSDRLSELPLGVFGIAIATVILPTLSRQHQAQDPRRFAATLDWSVRMIFVIGVPAAAALMVLAEPILFTLFQYGKTGTRDVLMAGYSLRAYSLGLLAFMLIKVLAPGFFAQQDTKTPVKIGVIAMIANMVLNIAFVLPLIKLELGHMGLALATSVSAYLNAGLLFWGLRRSGTYRFQPEWLRFALGLILGTAAMVAVLVLALGYWEDWSRWGALERALRLLAVCAAGAGVYAAGLLLAGLRLRHFRTPA